MRRSFGGNQGQQTLEAIIDGQNVEANSATRTEKRTEVNSIKLILSEEHKKIRVLSDQLIKEKTKEE